MSETELIAFAKKHRFRTRNLHDGKSVPPVRPKVARVLSDGYGGEADSHFAVVCMLGYIDLHADGKLGWCVLVAGARQKNNVVAELVEAGAVVTQIGQSEAAGHITASKIAELCRILKVCRKNAPQPGRPENLRPRARTESGSTTVKPTRRANLVPT